MICMGVKLVFRVGVQHAANKIYSVLCLVITSDNAERMNLKRRKNVSPSCNLVSQTLLGKTRGHLKRELTQTQHEEMLRTKVNG